MRARERTHCARGHLLAGANVRLQQRGRWVHRVCRECQEIGRRAYLIRRVRLVVRRVAPQP